MNAYVTSLAGTRPIGKVSARWWTTCTSSRTTSPKHWLQALEHHGDRVAAFIGEPVIGAGGVIPPPGGYWTAVASILGDHDVLLIADEVICGFGRLGTWFGIERYGVEPDLITCAKGISSGYIPLGATIVSRSVREPFWAKGAPPFRHGYTYTGHAAACAVALANLDVIEREHLLEPA